MSLLNVIHFIVNTSLEQRLVGSMLRGSPCVLDKDGSQMNQYYEFFYPLTNALKAQTLLLKH